ncbi:MAG: globin [Akkermansiaceae bacterium]|jgi:hemoglobin
MNEQLIYTTLGEEGFTRLTAGFYRRVREDDLIGPMYPNQDWSGAEERLRDFFLFRFGADQRYLEKRGHPMLRGRHMPFQIGAAEAKRWVELMGESADEVVAEAGIRAEIMEFFTQVAEFLRNKEE